MFACLQLWMLWQGLLSMRRGPNASMGLKAGRDVCWRAGCTRQTNLIGISKERIAHAAYMPHRGRRPRHVRWQAEDAADGLLQQAVLEHAPKLTPFRIIGADVAVEVDGGILLGVGPGARRRDGHRARRAARRAVCSQ